VSGRKAKVGERRKETSDMEDEIYTQFLKDVIIAAERKRINVTECS
jgi:hypothetical protein